MQNIDLMGEIRDIIRFPVHKFRSVPVTGMRNFLYICRLQIKSSI